MPGKSFSHILFLCLGAAVLAGFLIPGSAGAEATNEASRFVDLAASDVPAWCHQNLQLLSEPTRWLGYRNVSLLKRQFNPLLTSPVYYRAYVADRNVFAFSSEVSEPLSMFSTEDGSYTPLTGRPGPVSVSLYRRGSSYEVLVWCVMQNGLLLAVKGNDTTNPLRHGEITLAETPKDLFVQFRNNRYTIFTVNGTDSVLVYRLPPYNWITPERGGSIDTPGDATAMAHHDVTDTDSLFQLGHYQTAGPAKQLAISDTLLFVA